MKERLIYLLITLLFSTEFAYAYIDPGTGSILLQGLIAGIAAALVVIKLYWYRLKTFLFGRGQRDNSPAENVPGEDDAR